MDTVIVQTLHQHGYNVRKHQRLPIWQISAKGRCWTLVLRGDRFLSSEPWLQQWVDSLSSKDLKDECLE